MQICVYCFYVLHVISNWIEFWKKIPEFLDAVFSLSKEELGHPDEPDYRPIPSELQMLFANMLLLDQATVYTTKLTDSFGWNNSEVGLNFRHISF